MNSAGTPPTIELADIFATVPAATLEFSPIVTAQNTVAPAPIHTFPVMCTVAHQHFHLCKNGRTPNRPDQLNRLTQFFRNGDLPWLPIEVVPLLHPRSCCAMKASGARFPKTTTLENSVSNC